MEIDLDYLTHNHKAIKARANNVRSRLVEISKFAPRFRKGHEYYGEEGWIDRCKL